jgi:predicted transcriptional regulator
MLTDHLSSHNLKVLVRLLEWIHTMEELPSLSDISIWGRLGPLEQKVLEVVWSLGAAKVGDVVYQGKFRQTYPTIMSTMDRLFKKGLLNRVRDGRAFRYSPRYSPEELERIETIGGIRRLLASRQASLHLSYLVQAVGAQDRRLLDELHALVERQRAALKNLKP